MTADPRSSPETVSPTTLIVASDVTVFAEATIAALNTNGAHSVERATTPAIAGDISRRLPSVALLDMSLREIRTFIEEIRSAALATPILIVGVRDGPALVECAKAGATGFLSASASFHELLGAIDNVLRGGTVCSPAIAATLLTELAAANVGHQATETFNLTSREQAVWDCIGRGQSNKEIGQELSISESTVKHHVHHLLQKLEVTTRSEAAAKAFEQRIGRRRP